MDYQEMYLIETGKHALYPYICGSQYNKARYGGYTNEYVDWLVSRAEKLEGVRERAPNSDYTTALRSTIEAWSHDVGIADSIDDKGVIDLMQRLNTLKSAYCV